MEEPAAENAMKIDLRELEEGETQFTYEQDPVDLALAPEEVVFAGKINTSVVVHKLSDSLAASGKTQFSIQADCARCNEGITRTFEAEFAFIFQSGKPRGVEGDEDETLIWLDEGSEELDLGKEVRDYILLEIPINPVCEAYESGTCPNLVAVEEIERAAGGKEESDPRWAALRKVNLD
jgi:uncharacterized metal-binding protein YceD (DUF177 family)